MWKEDLDYYVILVYFPSHIFHASKYQGNGPTLIQVLEWSGRSSPVFYFLSTAALFDSTEERLRNNIGNK